MRVGWVPGRAILLALLVLIPAGIGSAIPSPALPPSALAVPGGGSAALSHLASAVASIEMGGGPAVGKGSMCAVTSSQTATCGAATTFVRPSASSGPVWVNLTGLETNAPSARPLGTMVWDAADNEVVLFGGCANTGCTGTPLSDTWVFSKLSWTDISSNITNTPPARSIAQMAYDPTDKEVLMFGGLTSTVSMNDTWTFSHGQWTNLSKSLTKSPPARYRGTMTWDGADGYVLLFGGTATTSATSPYADTWSFVSQKWTNRTGSVSGTPSGRLRAGMTYDASDGYVLLFGGCTSASCPTSDTWKYVNNTWTSLSLTTHPSARVYTGLTYDTRDGYALLFGGGASTSGPGFRDTWKFSGGAWTNITSSVGTAPSARGYEMLSPELEGNFTLLFGGYDFTNLLGDTWGFGPAVVATAAASPSTLDLGQSTSISVLATTASPPLGYSYAGLPSPCTSSDVATLSCKPGSAGSFLANITVNDSAGNLVKTNASFRVLADPTITSFTVNRTVLTQGASVLLTVQASSGLPPYRYGYRFLPLGCLSSNADNITCVPSASGNFTVQAVVTDSLGWSVTSTVNFTVNPPPSIPGFTAVPSVLDFGQKTTFYANTSGGTSPISYSYPSLPPGCATANIPALACTPNSTGKFNVKAQVRDADGFSFTANTSILVNADPVVRSAALLPGAVDSGQPVFFWLNGSFGTPPYAYAFTPLPI